MYVGIVRHSVNKCSRVLSNLLNSFDFAMRHQFRKFHHVQIIETTSILHAMGVLDDEEPVNVVANATHDTTQFGYSPLRRPTTAIVS